LLEPSTLGIFSPMLKSNYCSGTRVDQYIFHGTDSRHARSIMWLSEGPKRVQFLCRDNVNSLPSLCERHSVIPECRTRAYKFGSETPRLGLTYQQHRSEQANAIAVGAKIASCCNWARERTLRHPDAILSRDGHKTTSLRVDMGIVVHNWHNLAA
jgi:hypothetical protein